MTAELHPHWDDLQLCTATADAGEHRSAPRPLPVPEWLLRRMGGGAWCAQYRLPVAVGGRTTWVRLFPAGTDPDRDPRATSVPASALREAEDLFADLLEPLVADEPLVPRAAQDEAEPCQLPPGVEGTPCGSGCDRKRRSPAFARAVARRG